MACHTGDSSISLVNGKCVCSAANYSPDHFGWCKTCLVTHCISCISSNSNFCYACKDNKAFVNALGKCECPGGKSMSSDGYCPIVTASPRSSNYVDD